MKYEDLKGKSKDELNTSILDGKKELFNLRFQRTTGELDKTHRFKEIRKDIARAYTLLNSGADVKDAPKTAKKAVTKEKAVKATAEKPAKAAKPAKEKAEKKTAKKKSA